MSRFYFLLLFLFFSLSLAAKERTTLEIGVRAPDFRLPALDGKFYSLDDFREKKILAVIFTCNHCPTAQAYEDRIKQLVLDYENKGVTVVAISPNDPKAVRLDELGYTDLGDSFEDTKIRAKDKQFNFIYLYDGETQEASEKYGPVSTPHVFIFDQERRLRYTGRIDNNERMGKATEFDTRNALDALLNNRPVPVEKTKTSGCSIKWSEKRESAKLALDKWNEEPVSVEKIDEIALTALLQNETENLRVINVWATWCGSCVVEFPELVTINRMYRNREFELITISADDPENRGKVLQFLQKQHASFRNTIFGSGDRYKLIELVDKDWQGGLPYTLLVGPGGKILYRKMGPVEPLELKKEIVGWLGRYYK